MTVIDREDMKNFVNQLIELSNRNLETLSEKIKLEIQRIDTLRILKEQIKSIEAKDE